MVLSLVLIAAICYCLLRFLRGDWWANQAVIGISLPAIIVFASAGSLAIPLLVISVLAILITLPSVVRY